ncbi:hypothetical protein [Leptolyngbya ohadii]|uniref:hypothetical protein n=1 Tax=Leptolyngbya ohadii TaxID=1962290 RepID=UPI000B5A05B1|nr:hypothetical protein [Leptolyngbya ohadii]
MAKRMTKGTTQTGTTKTAKTTKTTQKRTTSSVPQGALSQVSLTLTDLPDKPKETWSLREVIEQLQEPISIALQRGYSYEEVVKILADCGIHITASSLKRYLSIAKRANSTAKQRRTRTPKSAAVQGSTNGSQPESQPEIIAAPPSELVVEMSSRRRRGRATAVSQTPKTAKASKTAQTTKTANTAKTAAKTKATPRTTASRKRSK